jgi:hypothetical protein
MRRGRCGCLCGLVQAGGDGGHGAVVGGCAGGEGEESFGAEARIRFEVDAVDGQEVGVQIVPVLDDPGVVG